MKVAGRILKIIFFLGFWEAEYFIFRKLCFQEYQTFMKKNIGM